MANIELDWGRELDDELSFGVHRVLHDVVAAGGAVGYLNPPDRATSDKWLAELLAEVRAGDGAFALARVDGRIEAFGCWCRLPWEPPSSSPRLRLRCWPKCRPTR